MQIKLDKSRLFDFAFSRTFLGFRVFGYNETSNEHNETSNEHNETSNEHNETSNEHNETSNEHSPKIDNAYTL